MPCASLRSASLRKCKLLAVLFLLPTPAPACHIYSTWHYKTPQHCGVALAQVTPRVISQARAASENVPTPTATPTYVDNTYQDALAELSMLLRWRALERYHVPLPKP